MSPKQMGRPKTENPKAINQTVRLDAETEKKLQSYCKKHNISKGEAIRQGIYVILDNQK